jgi:hypothetical protein
MLGHHVKLSRFALTHVKIGATHDLASWLPVTDDEDVGDVVDELLAEVQAARDSLAEHERHHERVKALMVAARIQKPDLGPDDLEEMTGKYMDRSTISRITVPEMRKQGVEPTRKPRRRRSRS